MRLSGWSESTDAASATVDHATVPLTKNCKATVRLSCQRRRNSESAGEGAVSSPSSDFIQIRRIETSQKLLERHHWVTLP
jgi:hypothetical protein